MIRKYITGAINITTIPILATLLLLGIYKTSINPKEGIIIVTITTTIVSLILSNTYLSKKEIKYNIGQFIAISINIILIFSIYNLNKNYNYIENIFSNNYHYLNNNIYVLKSTKYKSSNQLSNKKIGILKSNSNNSIPIIENSIENIEIVEYSDKNTMIEALYNGEVQSILLNENETKNLKNNSNKIIKDTRTIYEIKIKSEV